SQPAPRNAALQAIVLCGALALSNFAGATPTATAPTDLPHAVAAQACGALAAHVDTTPGHAPLLLVSYEATTPRARDPPPTTAAFTYDNALAVIALVACGKNDEARRIGEALLAATTQPRVLNTYRAGVAQSVPLPNGWWSATENRWIEDSYQSGSATGNVAWV